MKPEQLEAIRIRSDKASGNWLADYLKLQSAQIVLTDDVPALIAEVERLEKENGEYERALSQIAHGDTHTAYPHDIAAWALGLENGGGK